MVPFLLASPGEQTDRGDYTYPNLMMNTTNNSAVLTGLPSGPGGPSLPFSPLKPCIQTMSICVLIIRCAKQAKDRSKYACQYIRMHSLKRMSHHRPRQTGQTRFTTRTITTFYSRRAIRRTLEYNTLHIQQTKPITNQMKHKKQE